MNRREFLKAFVAIAAAPAIEKIIPTEIADAPIFNGEIGRFDGITLIDTFAFNPAMEYGNTVEFSIIALAIIDVAEKAKEILFEDARKILPSGTRFYILDGGSSNDYGNYHALAWYYSPRPREERDGIKVLCEAIA